MDFLAERRVELQYFLTCLQSIKILADLEVSKKFTADPGEFKNVMDTTNQSLEARTEAEVLELYKKTFPYASEGELTEAEETQFNDITETFKALVEAYVPVVAASKSCADAVDSFAENLDTFTQSFKALYQAEEEASKMLGRTRPFVLDAFQQAVLSTEPRTVAQEHFAMNFKRECNDVKAFLEVAEASSTATADIPQKSRSASVSAMFGRLRSPTKTKTSETRTPLQAVVVRVLIHETLPNYWWYRTKKFNESYLHYAETQLHVSRQLEKVWDDVIAATR